MATASNSEDQGEAQQHYYCTEEPKAKERVVTEYLYRVIRTVEVDYYKIIKEIGDRDKARAESALLKKQAKIYGPLAQTPSEASLDKNGKAEKAEPAKPQTPPGPKASGERMPPGLNFMSPTPTNVAAHLSEPIKSVGELREQLRKEGLNVSSPSEWGAAPSRSKN